MIIKGEGCVMKHMKVSNLVSLLKKSVSYERSRENRGEKIKRWDEGKKHRLG